MDRQQKKKEKQRKCCDSVKEIDRVKIFYATQAGRAKVSGIDPLDLSHFLCKAPQKSRPDSGK